MCGICGIVGPAAPPAARRETVKRMMALIAHRGPDGEGLHEAPQGTLGHRRLAIIDLDHGQQPMLTEDGRHVLVFNGEIYNYVELREKLTRQGVRFHTFSDTEVLLQLLVRDGEAALKQLNGMFAFAFFDQHTGDWILGRDPFGIKPLYYTLAGDELVFASEIKALFAHSAVTPEADWSALQEYLTFQFCLYDRTLFRGIRKVEPGCLLAGNGANVQRIARYWDASFHIDEHHTETYFVDRLRSLVEDSTRLQLRSDVPIGAYLSGGLDSSVIALTASRYLGDLLKVFHGTFAEGPEYDESRYATAAANAGGCEMHTVTATAQQFAEDLPRLIYAMDEPVAGPGLFPQHRVSRFARQHVKVLLGGQGGDEIFGGYARYLVGYLEQALKGAIFETQEEGRHVVTLPSIIPNLPLLREYGPLMRHFWGGGLFEEMDSRYFRLIDRTPDIQTLLSDDARRRFDRAAVFAEFQRLFNHPDTLSYFNKMTHFDMQTLLPALLQVEDRVSMSVSLESRVPFLDTRIVELVCSMPPQVKFRGGRTKQVLRLAAANIVPPQILARKDKMGFPVPLNQWVRAGIVREFVGDTLLGRASRERGLFSVEGLTALVDGEAAFGRQLWGALCVELWHQQFIDRAGHEPLTAA